MFNHVFSPVSTVEFLPPPTVARISPDEFAEINDRLQFVMTTFNVQETPLDGLKLTVLGGCSKYELGDKQSIDRVASLLRPAIEQVLATDALKGLEGVSHKGELRLESTRTEPGITRFDNAAALHVDGLSVISSNDPDLTTVYALGKIKIPKKDKYGERINAYLKNGMKNLSREDNENDKMPYDLDEYILKAGDLVIQDRFNPHRARVNRTGRAIRSTLLNMTFNLSPAEYSDMIKSRSRQLIKN